jgi:hypothetical protein
LDQACIKYNLSYSAGATTYPIENYLFAYQKETIESGNSSAIVSMFDVNMFLRTFVMEVATGNWDGIYDSNNYYLYPISTYLHLRRRYYNPDLMKFQYFRHDLDCSFGTFRQNFNFSTANIYTWGYQSRGAPIIKGIFRFKEYQQAYTSYFEALLRTLFFPNGPLKQLGNSLITSIKPCIQLDNWHHFDYAFSTKECESAMDNTITRDLYNPIVIQGINEFIQQRYTSAWQQIGYE